MNNATISRADRATHLKIVAVSLAASLVVLTVAMAAHVMSADQVQTAHGPVVKASRTVVTTANDTTAIR